MINDTDLKEQGVEESEEMGGDGKERLINIAVRAVRREAWVNVRIYALRNDLTIAEAVSRAFEQLSA